jgi:hypothetical protein
MTTLAPMSQDDLDLECGEPTLAYIKGKLIFVDAFVYGCNILHGRQIIHG